MSQIKIKDSISVTTKNDNWHLFEFINKDKLITEFKLKEGVTKI